MAFKSLAEEAKKSGRAGVHGIDNEGLAFCGFPDPSSPAGARIQIRIQYADMRAAGIEFGDFCDCLVDDEDQLLMIQKTGKASIGWRIVPIKKYPEGTPIKDQEGMIAFKWRQGFPWCPDWASSKRKTASKKEGHLIYPWVKGMALGLDEKSQQAIDKALEERKRRKAEAQQNGMNSED